MTKFGPALVLIGLLGGCGSHPSARTCMVDEDCLDTTQYCDGVVAQGTTLCTEARSGTCRAMDMSTLGAVCAGDEDCKFAESACLNGVCAVNACLSTGGLIVCDHGQCPATDASSASVTIVECAPGCRAGSRLHTCRSCFCEICAAPDGSTTANDGAAD